MRSVGLGRAIALFLALAVAGCGGRSPQPADLSALELSRPNLSMRRNAVPRRRGRPPAPDEGLVAAIRTLITDLPTYGYRVHALLRRQAEKSWLGKSGQWDEWIAGLTAARMAAAQEA